MEESIRLFPKRLPNQNIESEKFLFRPPQSIREQFKTQCPHYFKKEITLQKYNLNEIEKKKYPKTRKNRELNNISNYNNEPNSNSKTSSKKKEVYLICFKPY
jgi:hypothetical protein